MKKWEKPQVTNLIYSMTNNDYEVYGNGGGNGNGQRPGNLNHRCPDCGGCFQSNKDLADHRKTDPNNPLGGTCPGFGYGGVCGPAS